ncbi:MAG: L-threonylcarbamoyladenylate synthase [Candidatus Micrarchaeota archaeon]|nr:L-threonylcarbamoyladenylate synthase [Candidatus Micrarchaeota archaeon]
MKTKLYQFILKEREKTAKVLEQVAGVLQNGGVVAIPTETCYSLAIDSTNVDALEKLLALGVVPGLTNPVIVSDLRMAREYMAVNESAEKICHSFMPGPVTLVVDVSSDSKFAPKLFPQGASFRISSNVFTRALASELGKPITVAILPNTPVYKLKELQAMFDTKLDAIVSSGDLPSVMPSTVVDMRKETPLLVRQGPVPFEEITRVVAVIPAPVG